MSRGAAAALSSFRSAERCPCAVLLAESCLGALAEQSLCEVCSANAQPIPGPRQLSLPVTGGLVPAVPGLGPCSVVRSPVSEGEVLCQSRILLGGPS